MFFSVITYFWGLLKNLIFRGGSPKTNIEKGLPKKRGLDSLQIYEEGGLARKREVVFLIP